MKIFTLSGVLLNHQRLTTKRIIFTLEKHFEKHYDEIVSCDVIVLGGSMYYGVLQHMCDDTTLIFDWIHKLLDFCHEHDILLRVLEGKHALDRSQGLDFVRLNNGRCDVQYIKELFIEEINGINLLYVPEGWRATALESLVGIRNAIKGAGLVQVDVMFLHANLNNQEHKDPRASFDLDLLQPLVKKVIVASGSTEKHVEGLVVTTGAFTRSDFDQPSDKGSWIIDVGIEPTIKQLKNYRCSTYIVLTVDQNETYEEFVLKCNDTFTNVPYGTFGKIITPRDHPVTDSFRKLACLYYGVVLYKEVIQRIHLVEDETVEYIPRDVSSENIVRTYADHVDNHPESPRLVSLFKHIVQEYNNG